MRTRRQHATTASSTAGQMSVASPARSVTPPVHCPGNSAQCRHCSARAFAGSSRGPGSAASDRYLRGILRACRTFMISVNSFRSARLDSQSVAARHASINSAAHWRKSSRDRCLILLQSRARSTSCCQLALALGGVSCRGGLTHRLARRGSHSIGSLSYSDSVVFGIRRIWAGPICMNRVLLRFIAYPRRRPG
jgi:hypothetical protein